MLISLAQKWQFAWRSKLRVAPPKMQHSALVLWVQNNQAFDFIYGDERYLSIIKQIGIPPAC